MSSSLPGNRELPASRYDLDTYWGRVRHTVGVTDPSTLLAGKKGLEHAKSLVTEYKTGKRQEMTPELFVLSNLIVTAGMLQPGLGAVGTVAWQVANQSLNVAINSSNANKSSPMTTSDMVKSYFVAVGASCSVALGLNAAVPKLKVSQNARNVLGRLVPFAAVATAGALNVYLMRRGEIATGIDVRPVLSEEQKDAIKAEGRSERDVPSLGRSRTAARLAVGETAASRVFNNSPIMILPALALYHIQTKQAWYRRLMGRAWLQHRPRARMAIPISINLGLIAATSFVALPLALAVFPQYQEISADSLEPEFHGKGGVGGKVVFNRGL
ncbi:to mitochondrial cation transporter, partial [Geosmithia morbida]